MRKVGEIDDEWRWNNIVPWRWTRTLHTFNVSVQLYSIVFLLRALVSSELGLRFSWVIKFVHLPKSGAVLVTMCLVRGWTFPIVTGRKVIPVHCLEESACLGLVSLRVNKPISQFHSGSHRDHLQPRSDGISKPACLLPRLLSLDHA
jgi:hypothetical protein